MRILVFLISITCCFANPIRFSNRTCGVPAIKPDTSTNIVGGKEAIPYSWPWQVFVDKKLFIGHLLCGGTLISNQWVLTAGHCVKSIFGTGKPDQFTVKLGVFNNERNDEPGEQVLRISEVRVHPKFSGSIFDPRYDVALLKLEKAVEFDDHISPVCLPAALNADLPAAGTATFVTGWGNTEAEAPILTGVHTLQQVSIPIVSMEKCKIAYPGAISEDLMFCAGPEEGGKGSCRGDSGGPIAFQDPANDGKWTQIGIVSFGKGCAQPGLYGVNSRISGFIDFIQEYVKDL